MRHPLLKFLRGGEGGITRRYAPRPFGAALTGVIPASSLPRLSDRNRRELTCRVAEREGLLAAAPLVLRFAPDRRGQTAASKNRSAIFVELGGFVH